MFDKPFIKSLIKTKTKLEKNFPSNIQGKLE